MVVPRPCRKFPPSYNLDKRHSRAAGSRGEPPLRREVRGRFSIAFLATPVVDLRHRDRPGRETSLGLKFRRQWRFENGYLLRHGGLLKRLRALPCLYLPYTIHWPVLLYRVPNFLKFLRSQVVMTTRYYFVEISVTTVPPPRLGAATRCQ